MNLTEHLALVFHVFIAVAVMVTVCGRHSIGLTRTGTYTVEPPPSVTTTVEPPPSVTTTQIKTHTLQ